MDHDGVRELLALEAIKQLKARYFRTRDTQDWDGFGSVFARDAVLEVPEAGIVRNGRDAIVASVSKALAGARWDDWPARRHPRRPRR